MEISLEAADRVFDWANIALGAGLVISAAATVAVLSSAHRKEEYLKRDVSAAHERAAAANKGAAEANVRGEEAKAQSSEANARAAEASNEAAQARLAHEKLKAELAWRELSSTQRSKLVSALKGKVAKVTVAWLTSDPEASAYAEQLGSAIEASGASVEPIAWMSIDRVPIGVTVMGVEGPEADALIAGLKAAGINIAFERRQQPLLIWVGTKPR